MKQVKTILVASLAGVVLTFSGAMAGDMSMPKMPEKAMEHGGGQGMGMEKMDHSMHGKDMGTMDHSAHMGENIRNATVDGYQLAYHMMDMKGKMTDMKSEGQAPMMKKTLHLMLYVNDPEGKPVAAAKVGYLVTGPNGSDQKMMCMAMGVGGYGANVDFSTAGDYTITSKIVVGDKTIKDNFTYTAK
jgi:hypothetical protein